MRAIKTHIADMAGWREAWSVAVDEVEGGEDDDDRDREVGVDEQATVRIGKRKKETSAPVTMIQHQTVAVAVLP